MGRIAAFLLSTLLALPLFSLNWNLDFEAAKATAKQQNRPLLVYFSGKWCVWCVKLENDFLNQPDFAAMDKEMILVKLDYPSQSSEYSPLQAKLKKDYKVFSFPTLVILSGEGQYLGSVGYPRDSIGEYMAKIRSIAQIKMVQEKPEDKSQNPQKTGKQEAQDEKITGKEKNQPPAPSSKPLKNPKDSKSEPSKAAPAKDASSKESNKEKEPSTSKAQKGKNSKALPAQKAGKTSTKPMHPVKNAPKAESQASSSKASADQSASKETSPESPQEDPHEVPIEQLQKTLEHNRV